MFMLDKLDRHTDLMGRMAATTGVDMGTALAYGDLGAHQWRSAVLRCTTCDAAEVCEGWLDRHAGETDAGVPEFCVNRGLMQRLRA